MSARLTEFLAAQAWTVTNTSGANAAVNANKAAVDGSCHYITGYLVALRGAQAAADAKIQVKEGNTVKITDVIGNGASVGTRVSVQLARPIKLPNNTLAGLSVEAAGAGCIVEATLFGFTL